MTLLKRVFLLVTFFCSVAHAQLLLNNTTLNVQSVQRWMESNRDLSAVVQSLDGMYASDAEIKAFDGLSVVEQDKKINEFLQQKNMLDAANGVAVRHGWKSVGEYMRLSTKLGNAIAAYFLVDSMKNLNAEQKKAMREKADPAVLDVPASDINFVKTNEVLLKQYMLAYSQGK